MARCVAPGEYIEASSNLPARAATTVQSVDAAGMCLTGTICDLLDPTGLGLLVRSAPSEVWRSQRAEQGYWPDGLALHAALDTETAIVDAIVLPRSEAVVRRAAWLLPGQGALANQVEFPAAQEDRARFQLLVMAGHDAEHAKRAAQSVAAAVAYVSAAGGSRIGLSGEAQRQTTPGGGCT